MSRCHFALLALIIASSSMVSGAYAHEKKSLVGLTQDANESPPRLDPDKIRQHCAFFLSSQKLNENKFAGRIEPSVLATYKGLLKNSRPISIEPRNLFPIYVNWVKNPDDKILHKFLDGLALSRLRLIADFLPYLRHTHDLMDLSQEAYRSQLENLRRNKIPDLDTPGAFYVFGSFLLLRTRRDLMIYAASQFLLPVSSSRGSSHEVMRRTFFKGQGKVDPVLAEILDESWLQLVTSQVPPLRVDSQDESVASHEDAALERAIDAPLVREYVEYVLDRYLRESSDQRKRSIKEEIIWGRLAADEGQKVSFRWLSDKYELSEGYVHQIELRTIDDLIRQFKQFLLARSIKSKGP